VFVRLINHMGVVRNTVGSVDVVVAKSLVLRGK